MGCRSCATRSPERELGHRGSRVEQLGRTRRWVLLAVVAAVSLLVGWFAARAAYVGQPGGPSHIAVETVEIGTSGVHLRAATISDLVAFTGYESAISGDAMTVRLFVSPFGRSNLFDAIIPTAGAKVASVYLTNGRETLRIYP